MEKINIVELLKDCPKGMELDCTICDDVVTLEYIDYDSPYPINVVTKDGFHHKLSKCGEVYKHELAKCVIFPKGKTTWEGFHRPFKDGDIVFSGTDLISIFKERIAGIAGRLHSYVSLRNSSKLEIDKDCWTLENIRFATKEEKQKLFDAIKANGYKWNAETKTLEKLIEPKFIVGNTIKNKNDKWQAKRTIKSYDKNIGYFTTINDWIRIEDQDDWELVSDKFDINTLVPFESKVLVRSSKGQCWTPAFFGRKCEDNGYITTFGWCQYCIPFEPNIYLMGTTQDCSNFYKTWE